MMSGSVVNLHALLTVSFRLADGSSRDVKFVVDAGFTGFLTLPQDVATLGLPLVYRTRALLADHSEIRLSVREGTILWNGNELNVTVLATGERPLLGTALLKEHELTVQFAENGLVIIKVFDESLPRRNTIPPLPITLCSCATQRRLRSRHSGV